MKRLLLFAGVVALVVVAGFAAMHFFMAPPSDLDLSRSKSTVGGLYTVSIEPESEPLEQGALHAWAATVATATGEPVTGARITVDGGMPQHGHGLPTAPQASEAGNGLYRIEGVRFNMGGWWVLKLGIAASAGDDEVEFNIAL